MKEQLIKEKRKIREKKEKRRKEIEFANSRHMIWVNPKKQQTIEQQQKGRANTKETQKK